MSINELNVEVPSGGVVPLTIGEDGDGRPFLLLHGGGGPQTVAGFAALLAERAPGTVLTPRHPGFDGTERPPAVASIGALADLYVALLERLGLEDVVVVGNSIGGWILAEMLVRDPSRIGSGIFVDAVGIEVPGHPVADFFALPLEQVFELSYYEPEKFAIDIAALPPEARKQMAGNRETLATYTREEPMSDPELAGRLAGVETPCLVVWGERDRIADPEYGKAFAEAIPGSEYRLLTKTGHMPQLETPDQLLAEISGFLQRRADH
jgi:pimeloyl-ACP methyl ester carboxylesterase